MVSSSIGKMPQVLPYSGAMLAMVARSASGNWPDRRRSTRRLFQHALLAQQFGEREHQVGGGLARWADCRELHAD